MKILIVGSSGFIGKNLLEYLSAFSKYTVFSPSSKELNILEEKAVEAYLRQHSFDFVIHCAIYNPRTDLSKLVHKEFEYDLRMFYNFEKYSHLFGKMFYFGSGAEYDKASPIENIKETDFPRSIPMNDYGFSKYIIQRQIELSKNIINMRVFGLFGKYENWKQTFISGACCKALKNIPITIRQNVYFDYLYIDDFCKIIHHFINYDAKYKSYNIVSGKRIDLQTIAKIVLEVAKVNVPIYICNTDFANEYSASSERLIEEIGDFEYTPIKNAIQNLYAYYKENESMIDLQSLLYQ